MITHPFHKHKLVYIEVPKTGCTSIKWALRHLRDGNPPPRPDRHLHGWYGFTHIKPEELHTKYAGYKSFVVVRNPYDRFRSHFDSMREGTQGWDKTVLEFAQGFRESKWFKNPHGKPQTNLIGRDLSIFDFVGKTEDMAAVYAWLSDYLGEDIPYVRENISKDVTPMPDDAKRIVAKMFATDFDVLPYER